MDVQYCCPARLISSIVQRRKLLFRLASPNWVPSQYPSCMAASALRTGECIQWLHACRGGEDLGVEGRSEGIPFLNATSLARASWTRIDNDLWQAALERQMGTWEEERYDVVSVDIQDMPTPSSILNTRSLPSGDGEGEGLGWTGSSKTTASPYFSIQVCLWPFSVVTTRCGHKPSISTLHCYHCSLSLQYRDVGKRHVGKYRWKAA